MRKLFIKLNSLSQTELNLFCALIFSFIFSQDLFAINSSIFEDIPQQIYSYTDYGRTTEIIVDQTFKMTGICTFSQTLNKKKKAYGKITSIATSVVTFDIKEDFVHITLHKQPAFNSKSIVIKFNKDILNYKQESFSAEEIEPGIYEEHKPHIYQDKRDFSIMIFSGGTNIEPYVAGLESIMRKCLNKISRREGNFLIAK